MDDTRERIRQGLIANHSLGIKGDSADNGVVARETMLAELDGRDHAIDYGLTDEVRDRLIVHARQDTAHGMANSVSILKRLGPLQGVRLLLILNLIGIALVFCSLKGWV